MKFLKNASKVSGLTMLSRIFGLIRDQFFAGLIGAGFFADCFVVAYRIPNMFRDLFAESALSSAFVPTLTKSKQQDTQKDAFELIAKLMGLILWILIPLVLLGILFAQPIVSMIAPGFVDVASKVETTALLTQIMFPFLIFVSMASIMMGIHHTHQSFTIPALAPVFFNLVSIGFGIYIYKFINDREQAVILWSVGTLMGGMAQMLIQMPTLLRKKRIPLPSFKKIFQHKRMKELVFLMIPAVIALSGAQINILVNTILASLLEEGAPSWLSYAFRLIQLPIGVFGIAISVVALAQASKDAAINDMVGFHKNSQQAMRLNWFLTIPCAFGLWILADPIVAMLFERGAFTAFDTAQTAKAIQFYALGLPFYAGVKVKGPIFFTMNLARIPMTASLVGILINVIFNVLMYKKLGHWGLALGTSIGMLFNFVLLSVYFQIKLNAPLARKNILFVIKVVLISILMALAANALSNQFQTNANEWGKIAHVLGCVGLASAVYFGLSWVFKVVDQIK